MEKKPAASPAPPYFQALPPYFGGKRRLCDLIFACLTEALPASEWPMATLVDPFCGGGSVALASKARGFRVLANDLAARAFLVAAAFIANDRARLTRLDVACLIDRPQCGYPRVAEQELTPRVFRPEEAAFIDGALHQASRLPGSKRALASVLLIKWLLQLHPVSVPGATDAPAANRGDYDRITAPRLRHYLKARRHLTADFLLQLASDVNLGVFPGRGEAYQLDAIEFLSRVSGDVVYLDPPFPGVSSYERLYAPLDVLFDGHRRDTSRFSSRRPPLQDLLAACAHIPILVLSYGNAVLGGGEITRMVRDSGRAIVRSIEVPYRHLKPLATPAKNHENREVIIVAKNA